MSTSVTPNWSVKPTEAMASTEAVTSPNPSEARNSDTAAPALPDAGHPASALSVAVEMFPTTLTLPDVL